MQNSSKLLRAQSSVCAFELLPASWTAKQCWALFAAREHRGSNVSTSVTTGHHAIMMADVWKKEELFHVVWGTWYDSLWSLIPPEHVAKLSPSWACFSLSVFWPVPECAIVTAPAQQHNCTFQILSDFPLSVWTGHHSQCPWLWNSARWGHRSPRSKITARITYHGISWRVNWVKIV